MTDYPTRTFVDSGVLIAGYNAQPNLQEKVLVLLEDPDRIFLSSPFVWHEVCPKAQFNKQHEEYRFYREYFKHTAMFNDVRLILDRASRESARSGVGPMDSLHVVAAHLLQADEFITTEKPGKSIYRTSLVKVRYAFDPTVGIASGTKTVRVRGPRHTSAITIGVKPKGKEKVSELGRILRQLSDQYDASGGKRLTIGEIQREVRELRGYG